MALATLENEHGYGIVLIERLWFTQRNLKRADQIPMLMQLLDEGVPFDEPIELHRQEDGEIVLNNGHHRVLAIWLSGRDYLVREEFVVYEVDDTRPRLFQLDGFLRRLPQGTVPQRRPAA